MSKYAVILFNLGGPDSLEAVEPFLYNLFCDRDIFRIPLGQQLFAKMIAKRRAPKVRARYAQIGGKSPINTWTEIQRNMLQAELRKTIPDSHVMTAMRYWHPMIREVASDIASAGFEKIVLLPLYPHYSVTTTGSSFHEWQRHYQGDPARLVYVKAYPEQNNYISALNERIEEALAAFPRGVRNQVQLVFSAHGTPLSLVKKGDPYSRHIQQTIEQVMALRRGSHDYHLCFQSKVGPVKWLEPATDAMIKELGRQGRKHILVIPVSFVSDHLETLHELDMEYREIARDAHIENYVVMKGLNDSRTFCLALKALALDALQSSASPGRMNG